MESLTTIENITRAEVDVAIATAKSYPRSISKFRQDAMTMATIDAEVAASCFYKLSRGGKTIEGPSVRLAEIVASAWGNLKFGSRIIAEDDKFVVAQGIAHDLEKNVSNTVEIRRRITDRDGRRYSDDMIVVTCNAACSIALRNAVFKTVPFTYAKTIFEQAKRTAIGDVKTISFRRQKMAEEFSKMGVTEEMLLGLVGKPTMEDVGLAEIETLIGVFTAIKDGDTTIEEQFQDVDAGEAAIAKDAKKWRATFNKVLQACETRTAHELACAAFKAEHPDAWTQPTHVSKNETFESHAAQHLERIANTEKMLPTWIKNASKKEDFYKLLEEYKKHPHIHSAETEDIIAETGRAFGCEEYFATAAEDESQEQPEASAEKPYSEMTQEERRAVHKKKPKE